MSVSPLLVQGVAALLFVLGVATVLSRRNLFFVLMGVELLLNAANLSFIGFASQFPGTAGMDGQLMVLLVIAVAAAEACIGLALVVCLFRGRGSLDIDAYSALKE